HTLHRPSRHAEQSTAVMGIERDRTTSSRIGRMEQTSTRRASRVHDLGEPENTFVVDDIPAPTPADFEGMSMDLSGWVPAAPGREPFTDWVLLDMRTAALALPDVTMSRGTYPVSVARPYVSGQEGVGVVVDAAPGRR